VKFGTYDARPRQPQSKINIGDTIISLALDIIYQYMNISRDEIVTITHQEVASYDGEQIVLPITRGYPQYHSIKGAFSSKITPVFICYSIFGSMNPEDVPILKKYEPIGCRDMHTYSQCRMYGIDAYISGCITMCFPKRKETKHVKEKVFLVDVSDELEQYIPRLLMKQAYHLARLASS